MTGGVGGGKSDALDEFVVLTPSPVLTKHVGYTVSIWSVGEQVGKKKKKKPNDGGLLDFHAV